MNCLVTGGAGFIGSHVARELLAMGHKVTVLDDCSGSDGSNVPDGAEFALGTITDSYLVNRIFAGRNFDYVFHLAAYAAENLSHFIKRFNYENNVIGSMNLINASVNYGVKCFVFTSSIAVYGSQTPPFTESMTPRPEDSYGIAKYAVEQELRISHEMFGLDYVIFRPHNVYGTEQNTGDKYRNVIGLFMNQCLLGQPMTIFGDGEQIRAFSYIDDIAEIIAKSPFTEGFVNDVFNIGGNVPTTINELAQLVAEAMGTNIWKINLPARKETVVATCDHSKVEVTGRFNKPYTPLRDGLSKMAKWVKQQGPREVQSFPAIEIQKNLPESWK